MTSVFFAKSAISPLVAKFAVKFSTVNFLNSGVVIYLLWLGILFSTAVSSNSSSSSYVSNTRNFVYNLIYLRAVVVAKLIILGISFLTSFILVLREALVT